MRGEDVNSGDGVRVIAGSPPHARGRLDGEVKEPKSFRITPACAGKTTVARVQFNVGKDHPRMRGEDPPFVNVVKEKIRITPACAGKTFRVGLVVGGGGDHPRMRGEDALPKSVSKVLRGSPPHARGRRYIPCRGVQSRRITPACAGKTYRAFQQGNASKDHPRMRGEDVSAMLKLLFPIGSPPHARGRQEGDDAEIEEIRITPACAGKTPEGRFVRLTCPGSPPHARGRLSVLQNLAAVLRDHPRMRGED